MKNNIRYKGNINNSSLIIFFNWKTKTPSDVTFLERISSEVSCDVGCCSSFQFCSSFCCFSSFCCCCSSHCFSTSSLTFPWTIPRFLHPFYTFSPAHRRAIRDTFILSFPRSSLHSFTASATVLSGHFLLTDVFYLTLLHRHFTCVYQCLARWGPAVLP